MPMGLNISPSIWQSYINAILDCLKREKILWNNYGWSFVIHSIKEITHTKLEDLLKALLKNGLKI